MEGQSGSFELPLTRFGGRFGKDTDTPTDEIINDDGTSIVESLWKDADFPLNGLNEGTHSWMDLAEHVKNIIDWR